MQVYEGLCDKVSSTIGHIPLPGYMIYASTDLKVLVVKATEVHQFPIVTTAIHLDKIVYPCHNLSSITDSFILSK